VTQARDGARGPGTPPRRPARCRPDGYSTCRFQDGFEAIRELRRVAPAVKDHRHLGGSRGDFDPLKAAEMLGADRTLRKPFGTDELLGAWQICCPRRGWAGAAGRQMFQKAAIPDPVARRPPRRPILLRPQ